MEQNLHSTIRCLVLWTSGEALSVVHPGSSKVFDVVSPSILKSETADIGIE